MPAELGPQTQDLIDDREITLRAAAAFDRAAREREDLKVKLSDLLLELRVKEGYIGQLEFQLAEERNRVQSYQGERDDAVDEMLRVKAHLSNVKAILADADLPPPASKRKRGKPTVADSGNGSGSESVPDQNGSPAPVAEG